MHHCFCQPADQCPELHSISAQSGRPAECCEPGIIAICCRTQQFCMALNVCLQALSLPLILPQGDSLHIQCIGMSHDFVSSNSSFGSFENLLSIDLQLWVSPLLSSVRAAQHIACGQHACCQCKNTVVNVYIRVLLDGSTFGPCYFQDWTFDHRGAKLVDKMPFSN